MCETVAICAHNVGKGITYIACVALYGTSRKPTLPGFAMLVRTLNRERVKAFGPMKTAAFFETRTVLACPLMNIFALMPLIPALVDFQLAIQVDGETGTRSAISSSIAFK